MLVDEWIKEMGYACMCKHSILLFSLKEGKPAVCDCMDESGGHHAT